MNFPASEVKKEKTENKVQAHKADEGKDRIPSANYLTVSLSRPEQAMDQPGLPPSSVLIHPKLFAM